MSDDLPLLSLAIWLPIISGIIILFNGNNRLVRIIALLGSLLTFIISLTLYSKFDISIHAMQFVELAPWIPDYDINYHLGIDGFSLPLIILTTLSTVIVVVAGWEVITCRVNEYMASFLIMEGLMIAVFSALDAILFYVVFEAMLIPLFLIIGIWGGGN